MLYLHDTSIELSCASMRLALLLFLPMLACSAAAAPTPPGKAVPPSGSSNAAPDTSTANPRASAPPPNTPEQPFEPEPYVPDPKPTPEEMAKRLADATVKTGDLKLPKGGSLAGPCWKTRHHAATIINLAVEDIDEFAKNNNIDIDLDGDGSRDEVLFLTAAGMTATFALYVMRGDCGYHAGTIEAGNAPRPTSAFSGGLRVLEASDACAVGCCPDTRHVQLAFKGSAYSVTKTWKTPNACREMLP